ncbi:helix-turn-helix domain-containing protein [Heliobacterium undosum]|uniref:Helix-turn-helix domain-containing protein n=2 Tax=Heliomicrobium undosum TaxID=121734 RepID=A0A845L8I0_9FIRM|nr:helix-turn-helix domain-containing protein [Heliomicrobium undosum]
MQDYVEAHLQAPVSLDQLASAAGYSPSHASRVFKELVGIPPLEYLRARRLSQAALRLRDTPSRVLEVALDAIFESHEGFTRAFSKQFGITPENYRKHTPPLPLFMPGSVRDQYLHMLKGEKTMKEKADTCTIFTQVVERPQRKLILLRGRKAADYFAYCEEVGCDVWGILCSLKGALYEPVGMWLPEKLRRSGTSVYAQGVEMPVDYAGPIPEGMEIIDLPPCKMMVFHGQPFADEEMEQAIGSVWNAMKNFRPESFGWQWADDDAPRIQMVPLPERGYIEARPVRERDERKTTF